MKRIILVFCVALLSIATIAQDKTFRFGLNFTPSVSFLKSDSKDYSSEGSGFGFMYGAVGEWRLADNFALHSGIQIDMFSGGKLMYPDTMSIGTPLALDSGFITYKYKLNYFSIPLILKMKTPEIGYFTYYGKFGITAGMNIKAKANSDYVAGNQVALDNKTISAEDIDISDDINLFRLNMTIGLGLEYSLAGSTCVYGGLTFQNGFTDILDGKNNPVNNENHSAALKAIQLEIGILF